MVGEVNKRVQIGFGHSAAEGQSVKLSVECVLTV